MIYCENIVNVTFFFLLLPKFRNNFFFPSIFDNVIATIVTKFFSPYFGNGIAAISLLQIFFFFSLWALHTHFIPGQRNFDIHITEIQHFLSPPFSSSFSYFLLNFGNGDTEIHSLSSQS